MEMLLCHIDGYQRQHLLDILAFLMLRNIPCSLIELIFSLGYEKNSGPTFGVPRHILESAKVFISNLRRTGNAIWFISGSKVSFVEGSMRDVYATSELRQLPLSTGRKNVVSFNVNRIRGNVAQGSPLLELQNAPLHSLELQQSRSKKRYVKPQLKNLHRKKQTRTHTLRCRSHKLQQDSYELAEPESPGEEFTFSNWPSQETRAWVAQMEWDEQEEEEAYVPYHTGFQYFSGYLF